MRIFLITMIVLLSACSTSPTGRSQFLLYSPSALDQMGSEAFAALKKQEPISHDIAINLYVQCVARATLKGLLNDDGDPDRWEIVVFASEEANAFALPGGKIGVYTGMLKVATTQDQLAAVIGHEIAHVVAEHSNERISTQAATQMGLSLANSSGVNPNVQALLGVGAEYGVLLPYSRAQESEADLIGLDIMARAGFNPQASVEVWKNMEAKYGSQPPEFLLTHPGYHTRMTDLNLDMPEAMIIYEEVKARGVHPNCHL